MKITKRDVTFSLTPSGHGHYKVIVRSAVNNEINGFTFTTSFMPAVDNYQSDDEKRQGEGFDSLFNDLLRHAQKTPQEKLYRRNLVKIIRAAGLIAFENAKIHVLEDDVKNIALHAPGIVARCLSRLFNEAARAWGRGNNSGDARILEEQDAICDMKREQAEAILRLWGVRTTYPGLYPCFELDGTQFYNTESLMLKISGKY